MANIWGNWKLLLPFIFEGSKITADGDCSHESKRHLLLGRKAMTNLDSILKSRDIICWQRPIWSNLFFPVVMYGCESWTIKKAERWRLMLLNCGVEEDSWVPWTARRSNQSIPKKSNPWFSLEGLKLNWNSNTLVTWCKELRHWKRSCCWGRLKE